MADRFARAGVALVAAAGVLAVTSLARWSRSLLVGIAYALVGAFVAFLFTFVWQFSALINGAPPVLPRPIAQLVSTTAPEVESSAPSGDGRP